MKTFKVRIDGALHEVSLDNVVLPEGYRIMGPVDTDGAESDGGLAALTPTCRCGALWTATSDPLRRN